MGGASEVLSVDVVNANEAPNGAVTRKFLDGFASPVMVVPTIADATKKQCMADNIGNVEWSNAKGANMYDGKPLRHCTDCLYFFFDRFEKKTPIIGKESRKIFIKLVQMIKIPAGMMFCLFFFFPCFIAFHFRRGSRRNAGDAVAGPHFRTM
jgi:hypothetical protein